MKSVATADKYIEIMRENGISDAKVVCKMSSLTNSHNYAYDRQMDLLASQPHLFASSSEQKTTDNQDITNRDFSQQSIYQNPLTSADNVESNYRKSWGKFYGAIASNTYAHDNASAIDNLDVTRLEQTSVLKLLNGSIRLFQHIEGQVSLLNLIDKCKSFMGVIWFSNQCRGSCILIGQNLVLTARHCVAGVYLPDLTVEFEYLEKRGKRTYQCNHCVESHRYLDFAVLVIEEEPGLVQTPALLECSEDPVDRDLPLLHHPSGKPLCVSVHAFGPRDISSRIITNHDTDTGSSGGAYLNVKGELIGVHLGSDIYCLQMNLPRYAISLREIVRQVPHGIIAKIVQRVLNQSIPYKSTTAISYLQPAKPELIIFEEGSISQQKLTDWIPTVPGLNLTMNAQRQISTDTKADVKKIEDNFPLIFKRVVAESLNRGGQHGETRLHSIKFTVESDHVPPFNVWITTINKTMQAILKTTSSASQSRDVLPAVTIPWEIHRVMATTIDADFREKLVTLCNSGDIAGAISLNLSNYKTMKLLPKFKQGVLQMLVAHRVLATIDDNDLLRLVQVHDLIPKKKSIKK